MAVKKHCARLYYNRRRTNQKNFGVGNTVLIKFCDISPKYDFIELYGYERKNCLKFRVKTKKEGLYFN